MVGTNDEFRRRKHTHTHYKYTYVPRQIKVSGVNSRQDKGKILQSKFFMPGIIESFNCDMESYSNLALRMVL